MKCPKCQGEARCADKRDYIYPGDSNITEVRAYVCINLDCLYSFTYRNSFLSELKRRDAKKWIESYERIREKQLNQDNQEELFDGQAISND